MKIHSEAEFSFGNVIQERALFCSSGIIAFPLYQGCPNYLGGSFLIKRHHEAFFSELTRWISRLSVAETEPESYYSASVAFFFSQTRSWNIDSAMLPSLLQRSFLCYDTPKSCKTRSNNHLIIKHLRAGSLDTASPEAHFTRSIDICCGRLTPTMCSRLSVTGSFIVKCA